jgi:hypothetical protein
MHVVLSHLNTVFGYTVFITYSNRGGGGGWGGGELNQREGQRGNSSQGWAGRKIPT